ncbi:MAG TPA: 30S ribosomal protein S20 [Planctomycetota bacterium]|nr:30S ribosomal protein S20 [Planctomycetota bacterium]
MATSKQSQKRIRTNEKARVANKAIRGVMKSAVKGVTSAKDAAEAKLQLAAAMKRLDKAAKAGVIHKNAAARRKSRLARKVNAMKVKAK